GRDRQPTGDGGYLSGRHRLSTPFQYARQSGDHGPPQAVTGPPVALSAQSPPLEGAASRSVAAAARSRARSPAVRRPPKAASNLVCAWAQRARAARSRAAPALVKRSILLRRSARPGTTSINPSRSSGRILRPSVVRSMTKALARALIVIGPASLSLIRIENWVVRSPLDARNWS